MAVVFSRAPALGLAVGVVGYRRTSRERSTASLVAALTPMDPQEIVRNQEGSGPDS